MIIKYSPFEAPFVPPDPGVYWVTKDSQYGPHQQHVIDRDSYLQSLMLEDPAHTKLIEELEELYHLHGIQAAGARLRSLNPSDYSFFRDSGLRGDKWRG